MFLIHFNKSNLAEKILHQVLDWAFIGRVDDENLDIEIYALQIYREILPLFPQTENVELIIILLLCLKSFLSKIPKEVKEVMLCYVIAYMNEIITLALDLIKTLVCQTTQVKLVLTILCFMNSGDIPSDILYTIL